MKLKQIKQAIKDGRKLVWVDPDPQDGNDYLISFIEPITKEFAKDSPITIRYNGGESEAEVFAHEIHQVITLEEYARAIGVAPQPTLAELQDYLNDECDISYWDYPLTEMAYFFENVNDEPVFVDVDGEIRICETETTD